jgi:hypothetical protein
MEPWHYLLLEHVIFLPHLCLLLEDLYLIEADLVAAHFGDVVVAEVLVVSEAEANAEVALL